MNLEEYKKVQNYDYVEYCDYLQNKYGAGLCDYMTKSRATTLSRRNRFVFNRKPVLSSLVQNGFVYAFFILNNIRQSHNRQNLQYRLPRHDQCFA